ncbi:MAG: hypothetical protein E5X41_32780 [Mesorhizobium sp.]|nr:MAG: hypothetical protein E5X41_32780 [Mesorhizobium sp.]
MEKISVAFCAPVGLQALASIFSNMPYQIPGGTYLVFGLAAANFLLTRFAVLLQKAGMQRVDYRRTSPAVCASCEPSRHGKDGIGTGHRLEAEH